MRLLQRTSNGVDDGFFRWNTRSVSAYVGGGNCSMPCGTYRKAQTLRCVPLSHSGWKAFGFNKKLKPIWTIADYTDMAENFTRTPPITSVWGGLIAEGDHEMKWNRRVVDMTAENGGEPLFAIREVFYNDDGVPIGHGEPSVMSETMEGLARCA
jgi:hypothetical protein